jgi:hypothetical protein
MGNGSGSGDVWQPVYAGCYTIASAPNVHKDGTEYSTAGAAHVLFCLGLRGLMQLPGLYIHD